MIKAFIITFFVLSFVSELIGLDKEVKNSIDFLNEDISERNGIKLR